MKHQPVLILSCLIVGLVASCSGTESQTKSALLAPSQPDSPLVVFIVRHAEKTDEAVDPRLSQAGLQRAKILSGMLKNSAIEHVHSSNFNRTKDTAAVTSTDLGLNVQLYDPANQSELVRQLKIEGGRHLVVGHSNSVPELVDLLGGESGSPIDEPSEFDRMYIVTLCDQDHASSVLLRYGTASEE